MKEILHLVHKTDFPKLSGNGDSEMMIEQTEQRRADKTTD